MTRAIVALLFITPLTALAQAGYNPLVNLPGGLSDPVGNFDVFLNTLYGIAIAVAALLAVIKIVVAGVKYMLSDVVTGKAAAKADIQGALLGLIIVISAILILNIINPGITGGDLGSGPGVDTNVRTPFTPVAPIAPLPGTSETNYDYLVVEDETPFAIGNFAAACTGEITRERGQIRCYNGNMLFSENICNQARESRGGACNTAKDAQRARCENSPASSTAPGLGGTFAIDTSYVGDGGVWATCVE